MTDWHPIETLPDGKEAILYQPPSEFKNGGMVIGSVERRKWGMWVSPSHICGYEYECDIDKPTKWTEVPAP